MYEEKKQHKLGTYEANENKEGSLNSIVYEF